MTRLLVVRDSVLGSRGDWVLQRLSTHVAELNNMYGPMVDKVE